MRLKELQSKLYQNRIDKGYSEIDIDREFCGLYSKVASAYKSYRKGKDKVGSDFAEIVLTLLNLSEVLDQDLEESMLKKISNKQKKKDEKVFFLWR